MRSLFNSPYRNIFIIGLFVFIITAFFSEGYHHPDEHFQILEFSSYMLGKSPASDLPWEFQDMVRPALQPALASAIIKTLNIAGIYNPFTYALILRIFTALLSWFLVCNVCLLVMKDFSSELGKKIFLFLSFFLWFIPFISVRFSSENYSAIAFLGAVCLILRSIENNSKKIFQLALAGFLLGFSFFFRFQIAFAIIGLGLWLIVIKKVPWRNIFTLLIPGICAIAFCIFLDTWFYGKVVLTPINYYYEQIIENKAANWGTFPWWYYFNFFIIHAIPPISIFLLVFFFIGLFRKRVSIFTWCIVPFLIAHFVVGHKEMRFLFPMAFYFIYLTAVGVDHYIVSGRYKKLGRLLFILTVIINIPVLIVRMITPAQEAISYYKFLYNYSLEKKITLLCIEKNIYNLVGFNANFYKSPNVKCVVLNDDKSISNYLDKNKPDSVYLFEDKLAVDTKYAGYINERVYCLFPKWLLRFNINNWESRSRIWEILELKKLNTDELTVPKHN
jgi:phosphatidylinositol glycan class B